MYEIHTYIIECNVNKWLRSVERAVFFLFHLCILPMHFGALVAVVEEVVGAEELCAGVALHREEVEAVARRVGAVAA